MPMHCSASTGGIPAANCVENGMVALVVAAANLLSGAGWINEGQFNGIQLSQRLNDLSENQIT